MKPLLITFLLINILSLSACGGSGGGESAGGGGATNSLSKSSTANLNPTSVVSESSITTSSKVSSSIAINSSQSSSISMSVISSSKSSSSHVSSSVSRDALLWSNTSTWPNRQLPKVGDNVNIPEGQVVELDITPPALGYLSINGVLKFKDMNIELTAKNIMVHGRLEVGTEAKPFMSKAVITLTDTDINGDQMGMGTRGLMVMGGALELHGNVVGPTWTKISAHADAATTQLSLINGMGWKAGDDIAVAPTDYYVIGRTELHRISAINANQLTLASPLAALSNTK